MNPILFAADPYIAGWALVLEFIFTLAMALSCYPLQPGGLLAFEAVVIGMASPEAVLLFTFTKLVVHVRSKILLSLMFSGVAAVLSAFLDALTVTAVVITVASGFYGVYHRVASGKHFHHDGDDVSGDAHVQDFHRGGSTAISCFPPQSRDARRRGYGARRVATLVGEPQNLLIGTIAGWEFVEFFIRMAPVSIPALAIGLVACVLLERFQWCGYGARLPEPVRNVLERFDRAETEKRTAQHGAILVVQALVAAFLVIALAFHWAAVGLIGLGVIVLATAFAGVTEEHRLGHAFQSRYHVPAAERM